MNLSRRDFMRQLMPETDPKAGTEAEITKTPENQGNTENANLVVRREVLKRILNTFWGGVLVYAVPKVFNSSAEISGERAGGREFDSVSEVVEKVGEKNPVVKKVAKEFSSEAYKRTAVETGIFSSMDELLFLFLKEKYGLEQTALDDNKITELMNEGVVNEFRRWIINDTVRNELYFRSIPNVLAGGNTNLNPTLGVLQALVYGKKGAFNKNENKDLEINPDEPLNPRDTLEGLFYWYLIRKRGLSHSILSHVENKTAKLVFNLLESKTADTVSE